MRADIRLRHEGLDIANRFLYLRTSKISSLPNWPSLLPIRHIPNSAGVAAALGIDHAQDLIVAVDTQNDLFPQDFFYLRALNNVTMPVEMLILSASLFAGFFYNGICS
jgi:hypothetical protein